MRIIIQLNRNPQIALKDLKSKLGLLVQDAALTLAEAQVWKKEDDREARKMKRSRTPLATFLAAEIIRQRSDAKIENGNKLVINK